MFDPHGVDEQTPSQDVAVFFGAFKFVDKFLYQRQPVCIFLPEMMFASLCGYNLSMFIS